ncbi:MAG: phage tail spike protein [Clostridium fessum]
MRIWKRYLDYLTDGGGTNDQVIRYGVNLADYSKTQDATELFTALIPTGADLEDTSSSGESTTKTVDITSVNGGKDFIYDEDAVQRYGWIFRQHKWEDVTLPENLIKKARAYLEQSIYLSDVLKLTAVDLANVDVDIKRLKTGYWTKVISRPHGVDVMYILEERTRNLQEPGKTQFLWAARLLRYLAAWRNPKGIICEVEQVGQAATRASTRRLIMQRSSSAADSAVMW